MDQHVQINLETLDCHFQVLRRLHTSIHGSKLPADWVRSVASQQDFGQIEEAGIFVRFESSRCLDLNRQVLRTKTII